MSDRFGLSRQTPGRPRPPDDGSPLLAPDDTLMPESTQRMRCRTTTRQGDEGNFYLFWGIRPGAAAIAPEPKRCLQGPQQWECPLGCRSAPWPEQRSISDDTARNPDSRPTGPSKADAFALQVPEKTLPLDIAARTKIFVAAGIQTDNLFPGKYRNPLTVGKTEKNPEKIRLFAAWFEFTMFRYAFGKQSRHHNCHTETMAIDCGKLRPSRPRKARGAAHTGKQFQRQREDAFIAGKNRDEPDPMVRLYITRKPVG